MLEGVFEIVKCEDKLYAHSQTMVESVVQAPEGKDLIAALATANVNRCEILNGEADIDGVVVFDLLFDSADTICLKTSCNFSQTVPIAGAKPRAIGYAQAEVSNVQAEVYAGEIKVSATVDLSAVVNEKNEIKCVTKVAGDGIQTLEKELGMSITAGTGTARTS
ncbi:MAG TPA: hypothetical protein PLZ84_07920, partial [Clostridia bacterium]|nr:hypothetical protein [Clostridia bacterium]